MISAISLISPLVKAADGDIPDDGSPRVTGVAAVAPDILSIRISQCKVIYSSQSPYIEETGDRAEKDLSGVGWVTRKGKVIGSRIGINDDILASMERLSGSRLNVKLADKAETYSIISDDDSKYAKGLKPIAVYRKSKPTNTARVSSWSWDAPVEHTIYLKLPYSLSPGKTYHLSYPEASLGLLEQDLRFGPEQMQSEAVHVTQVGFRPDDPVKIAFLSCWLGSGGATSYKQGTKFFLIDEVTGAKVFSGTIKLSKAADQEDEDGYNRNYNLTDVYEMDFSSFDKSGNYRVYVEGIGCSLPFPISQSVWRDAFSINLKGFYYQRSGIELAPPYSEFNRPRPFHPDDGVKVYQSTCTLMESGNGLNVRGTDRDNFGNLVKGKTDELVKDAWGGYFDAGDWDRKVGHLDATRLLLELADLYPDFFSKISSNIPESENDLPDILDECLWNLDCYRRMQTAEGGIRGGIESEEHPLYGEGSWQNSLVNMAYAPDPWSSYIYAGVAARAAYVLENKSPSLAKVYKDSAIKAMNWAENDLPRWSGIDLPHQVNDERNLAAIELFRLTGDKRWHELFMETTVFTSYGVPLNEYEDHAQGHAAFVYLRTKRPGMDSDVKKNTLDAILTEAKGTVEQGRRTGFHWTKSNTYTPIGWGVMSTPDVVNVLRAHWITRNPTFLKTAILAAQMGAGANPVNMCYTTGVGINSPRNPMWLDTRVLGIAPPPGITVYGPVDMTRHYEEYSIKMITPFCYPEPVKWPTVESYFDVYMVPGICEFTVVQTMGPNAYVWGYLAARK